MRASKLMREIEQNLNELRKVIPLAEPNMKQALSDYERLSKGTVIVKCIAKNTTCTGDHWNHIDGLIENELYQALDENDGFYYIQNTYGIKGWYDKTAFEVLAKE